MFFVGIHGHYLSGCKPQSPKFVAGQLFLFFLPAGERPGGSVPRATAPVSCPVTTVPAPPQLAQWPGIEVSNQTKLWMNLTRKPSASLSFLAMKSVQAGFPQPCNLPNFHPSWFTSDWKPGTSGTSTWPWAGAGLVSIRARIFRLTNTDGAETGRGASRKARELRHRLGEPGCCEGFHQLPPVPLLPALSSSPSQWFPEIVVDLTSGKQEAEAAAPAPCTWLQRCISSQPGRKLTNGSPALSQPSAEVALRVAETPCNLFIQ